MFKVSTKKDALIHLGLISGTGVVFILLFFYVYLPVTTLHGKSIQVPDLKGKSLAEVKDEIETLGLRYQVNDSTYVAGSSPNVVVSQHPLAGAEVKANRNIYVTITTQSAPLVAMPNLFERSLKAAVLMLKELDLTLVSTRSVPASFDGIVVKQYIDGKEIPAGTMVPKGSKVTLDIGNGHAAADSTRENNNQ